MFSKEGFPILLTIWMRSYRLVLTRFPSWVYNSSIFIIHMLIEVYLSIGWVSIWHHMMGLLFGHVWSFMLSFRKHNSVTPLHTTSVIRTVGFLVMILPCWFTSSIFLHWTFKKIHTLTGRRGDRFLTFIWSEITNISSSLIRHETTFA